MTDIVVKTFIVAGVVIQKDGKFLLVQEKQPKVYGLWNFPAGKVEVGSSIEETAIKEAKEESGYEVELLKKIDIYHEDALQPVKHAFAGKIVGGELQFPKDEILNAQWFTFKEINDMKQKLRGVWILDAIKKLEESK
jgi:ADP-ribose pyrophosphatase YjhB (NUDIX family)